MKVGGWEVASGGVRGRSRGLWGSGIGVGGDGHQGVGVVGFSGGRGMVGVRGDRKWWGFGVGSGGGQEVRESWGSGVKGQ